MHMCLLAVTLGMVNSISSYVHTHTHVLTYTSRIHSSPPPPPPPPPSPTTHTQWLQFLYFFLGFFTDIMPRSRAKIWFQKLCDLVFTTVIFPFAVVSGLCVTVWMLPAMFANHDLGSSSVCSQVYFVSSVTETYPSVPIPLALKLFPGQLLVAVW